ncbi:MAG: hypothetical protein A2Z02_03680 [Chloroflexi bacterium RBG_16_48_7]|nr:MAG: hypothetical protein A2Z02_03680 [Chloroflexi bacterium RBG_16_48_7]
MWLTFLKEMGACVVVSGQTNPRIIKQGAARVVCDTCLPLKAYVGHVISLTGNCDSIFIPILRSTGKKVLNCSRFLGLPDMIRAVVPEAPLILEIEFDLNRGQGYLYRQVYELGRYFSENPVRIAAAAKQAWKVHLKYQELRAANSLTYNESIDIIDGESKTEMHNSQAHNNGEELIVIGLIGHPYILCDEQVNHRLLERMNKFDVIFLTPEMLTTEQKQNGIASITHDTYWVSEEEVIGTGAYFLENCVDGIIGAMAFGCGPDSLMMHLIHEKARSAGVPFMCLTFEEHTAEVGIVTRLEAFLDMVRHRKRERRHKCA